MTYAQVLEFIKDAGFEQWSWVLGVLASLAAFSIWLFRRSPSSASKKAPTLSSPNANQANQQAQVGQQIGGSGNTVVQHNHLDAGVLTALLNQPVRTTVVNNVNHYTVQNYSKDPADQARIKALEDLLAKQSAAVQEQYRQGFLDAQKLAEKPNASASDQAAFKDLQAGKPEKAALSAREQERLAATAAQKNNAEAAKWARHQAAFDQLVQPNGLAALQALQRAVAYEPDNYLNQLLLGDALVVVGQRPQALLAFQAARKLIDSALGPMPADSNLKRDLSVSYNRIGDLQNAEGKRADALKSYQDGLGIRKTLAALDKANTEWQRDLSVSYDKIGDLQNAEGKRADALKSYQDGLNIAKTLAALDQANTQWQTDLVVSGWKLSGLAPDTLDKAAAVVLLRDAHQILARLKAMGALHADQQGWSQMIQTRLDGWK